MATDEENILGFAKNNQVHDLREILKKDIDINVTDDEGMTALHHAATEGHVECLTELINAGANIEAVEEKIRTPLHQSARYGKYECLVELLKAGAVIDPRDVYEQTPLHWASATGKEQCIDKLIKGGANVNLQADNGFMPLRLALVYGHEDCAKVLMAADATSDQTVLHTMTMKQYAESVPDKDPYSVQLFAEGVQQERVMKGINSVDKGLPWEVQNLDKQSAELFTFLIEEDSYELFDTRNMLVGEQGVGKTTLANFLTGKSPLENQQPTDGIGLYTGLAFLDKEAKEWLSGTLEFTLEDLLVSRMLRINPLKSRRKVSTHKTVDNVDHDSNFEQPSTSAESNQDDNINQASNPKRQKLDIDLNPLGEGKQTENDVAISVTKYSLLEKSWNVGEKKLHKLNIVPVIIWDFGGQDVFYATHQTFLTYRAIYMVVINGSRPLDDNVEYERQYMPGKSRRKTRRDYVTFWVKTILTYCKTIGTYFPKLLIVATHKDKVEKEKIESVRKSLYDEIDAMFLGSSLRHHVLTDKRIFVDATDHNDPEMILLKKTLTDLAFMQPSWGELMPTCFLPLEMELNHLVHQSRKKVITVDYLKNINRLLPIRPLTSEELQLFLKVQHAIGTLLYFPLPNLDDKIILAPTHLIDAFRSIVTDRQFCGSDEKRLTSWDDMASKGIIKKSTIEYTWQKEQFKHFMEDREYLLALMTHLDILSEPRRYDKEGNRLMKDFFLVPSMVREKDNTSYFKCNFSSERTICLSFICLNEILPPALCYRFLTYCIGLWPLKRYGDHNEKEMLFEDVAVLVIDNLLDMSVHCGEDRLLIRLIHDENKSLIPDVMASSIRECLTAALQNISQLYQQLCIVDQGSIESNNQSIFAVQPCCSASENPCTFQDKLTIDTQNVWICPNHKIEHTGRSLQAWFSSNEEDYECSSERICPVSDDKFLNSCPNDMHLRRLSLELTFDEMGELFIHLGLKSTQWKNLQMNKKVENVIFESLIKWRDSSESGTFNDLKKAMEDMQLSVHKICKVLRERFIDFDKTNPVLDRIPTDEDIDRLAPFVGADSLHFLVELGLEFQDWNQIEYKCGRDLVHTNRTILNVWKEKCENGPGVRPTLRTIYKAFANIGKSQRVVERCFKKEKY